MKGGFFHDIKSKSDNNKQIIINNKFEALLYLESKSKNLQSFW